MANPFLVLGGIAISAIVAGVGAVTAPGWVNSASDAAAKTDLSTIRTVQSAFLERTGWYAADADALTAGISGIQYSESTDVNLDTANTYGSSQGWCAVAQSRSGKFFAASSKSGRFGEAATAADAKTEAKCPDKKALRTFTIQCATDTEFIVPLAGVASTAKARWSDGAVQSVVYDYFPERNLHAGTKLTVTVEADTSAGLGDDDTGMLNAAARACIQ